MEKVILNNKKAFFDYFIIDSYEAGIVLLGTEIKSIRSKTCSIADSYIQIKDGEMYIINMHIAEYKFGNIFNHDPYRTKKLLMHKKEILKLSQKVKLDGFSIVPTKLYLDEKGKAKLTIALVQGKKLYDKREDSKIKDIKREAKKATKY